MFWSNILPSIQPENRGSSLFWNVGTFLPVYPVSYLRRQYSSFCQKPKISQSSEILKMSILGLQYKLFMSLCVSKSGFYNAFGQIVGPFSNLAPEWFTIFCVDTYHLLINIIITLQIGGPWILEQNHFKIKDLTWQFSRHCALNVWDPHKACCLDYSFSLVTLAAWKGKRCYGACKPVRLLWWHSKLLPERKTLPTETRSRYTYWNTTYYTPDHTPRCYIPNW
jgi:hypothetical protein